MCGGRVHNKDLIYQNKEIAKAVVQKGAFNVSTISMLSEPKLGHCCKVSINSLSPTIRSNSHIKQEFICLGSGGKEIVVLNR